MRRPAPRRTPASASLLAALLLAACTHLADAPAASDHPVPHYAGRLTVPADRRSVVDRWFDLAPDCHEEGRIVVTLETPPANGRVAIMRGRFQAGYPGANPRAACNRAPQPGITAFYHPAPGYSGPDAFSVRITLPDGKSWISDYQIGVQ